MPCTPIAERASRTSSSLNGLMIAVTSFIFPLLWRGRRRPLVRAVLERVAHEGDQPPLVPVLALDGVELLLRVRILVVRAGVEAGAEVVGGAELPHGGGALVVVEVA